jgi:hypothetical protein
MSDDVHPLALRDVQRDDAEPLSAAAQLATLKRVAAQFCFDTECPICGQAVCEGDRHECQVVTFGKAI